MADFTDITVLLDRSGSMSSIKAAMESGFNEFLQQHRAVPSSRLTLVQFDTDDAQEVVYTEKPIAEAPSLDLTPRGGTPLLDALCRAIDGTGARFKAMDDGARPDRVLFVIITDGQENASHEFKREDVFKRITTQSSIYKWQFVYLGANQDAFAEAASFGIAASMTANYAASASGTQNVMRAMASNTVSYSAKRSAVVRGFSDEQRADALDKKKNRPTTNPKHSTQ